ncbi:hypothetical protein K466DRAFT_565549 [Polyporus arcularius HHB13444]|uniref:Uncharacterized protein n=1 Tax=Polyporus arcularius HHB13444 TaxID=1314778 RepID=A0A5C3PDQ3_9APHY|nr:hypothetical protein K466DRAFT_565549 [Polyporus arcularius HHB13444]
MSSLDDIPLNYLISQDHCLELCKRNARLRHSVDPHAPGPSCITFQKCGSHTKGFPLSLLRYKPSGPFYELQDASNEEIRILLDRGLSELHLVFWAPDHKQGAWRHHIRTVPVVSTTFRLTNKSELAHLIALEYFAIFTEGSRQGQIHGDYPEMQPGMFNLVALRRIFGNVYQVEIGPSTTTRVYQYHTVAILTGVDGSDCIG